MHHERLAFPVEWPNSVLSFTGLSLLVLAHPCLPPRWHERAAIAKGVSVRKKLRALTAAVCSVVLAFGLTGCLGNGASTSVRFVTGGESGTYYAYGNVIAQYATNGDYDVYCIALSGNGSQANMQALEDGDAELGFCQSDVLAYAYDGTKLFEGAAYKDFSIVAALYQEQVQIVTCDPNIKSVADLAGKTVSVGAAGSGVYFNAVDMLAIYGLDINSDVNAVYQDFGDSVDSLKDGKIDAAFVVAGAPTTAITDLSTTKDTYLISMDQEHADALVESSPYYAQATISKDVYGTEDDILTVAVLAVIVTTDDVSEDGIYNFTKSIFDGAENNADAHAKYAELDLETAASITTVGYHPGAAKYYAEQGIDVPTK